MPKPARSKKKPFQKPSSTPLRKASACRWLVLVDERPIRQAALAEYHTVEKQITKAREQLEAFELGDRPAYQRWEAKALGPLMTELRDCLQQLDQKALLAEEIEEEMFWSDCTEVTAYKRVMKAREEPEEFADEDEDDAFPGGGANGAGPKRGDRLFGDSDLPPGVDAQVYEHMTKKEKAAFHEFYEMVAAMYVVATGRRAPTLEEALYGKRREDDAATGNSAFGSNNPPPWSGQNGARNGRRPRPGDMPEGPAKTQETNRLKDLYRKLVRLLHPDRNHEQTPREKELWHQVQEAYRAHDLGKMEAVAGRLEIGLPGAAAKLPIQILLRMTRDLMDALRGLRRQLNEARSHPAWKFSAQTTNLPKFEAQRKRQLVSDLQLAKARLARITARLDEIAAKAERKRTRPSKKATRKADRDQETFPF